MYSLEYAESAGSAVISGRPSWLMAESAPATVLSQAA